MRENWIKSEENQKKIRTKKKTVGKTQKIVKKESDNIGDHKRKRNIRK